MLQGLLSLLSAPRAAAALSTLPAPWLHTCALTLQLLLESLRTQVATPFSSLIMSIHCACTSVSHVRMHLFPGVSTCPTESLTVAQCNQILKLKLEPLDIKTLAVMQSCCHIFIIQWVPRSTFLIYGLLGHVRWRTLACLTLKTNSKPILSPEGLAGL